VIPSTLPDKLDWQLRLDIDQRLWWSPFVDSEAIEVSAEDDVATLTGIVDNWLEHSVATRSAYEAGAARVRDRLKIRRGPAFYRP
jgi:osmotically-inducible protein OsmY